MFRILLLVLFPSLAAAHPTMEAKYATSADGVVSETDGGANLETPFPLASVGKTMTSVAILRAVQDGRLNLQDPVWKWVDPEISRGFGGLRKITIRHLLTMTSGLPDYYGADYIDDAQRNPGDVHQAKIAVTYAYDIDRLPPDQRFEYSNTNYVLLGLILETLYDADYSEVMDRVIFKPADMRNSFVYGSRPLPDDFPRGHEGLRHVRDYYANPGFGDGGVAASVVDLAKFYRALFIEKVLINDALLQEMLIDPKGDNYGMGIVVGDGFVGHDGSDLGFTSTALMELETGAFAAALAADGNVDTDWVLDQLGF